MSVHHSITPTGSRLAVYDVCMLQAFRESTVLGRVEQLSGMALTLWGVFR
jgi:hypothetical protein